MDFSFLDRMAAWGGLGISILTYLHYRRLSNLQGAEHVRQMDLRRRAKLQIRLRRTVQGGAEFHIHNAGEAAAHDVVLDFPPESGPADLAADGPIPTLYPGESFAIPALVSEQDPSRYMGELRWRDGAGDHQEERSVSSYPE